MQVGDVVPMTSCTVVTEARDGSKLTASFKVRKRGERFHFLFLGVDTKDAPLDPVAVLTAMGWKPSKELAKLLAEQEAEGT